jgi:hypothetical protein
LIFILYLPTVFIAIIVLYIYYIVRFDAVSTDWLFFLLEQLAKGAVTNLLEVVLVAYLLHVEFPRLYNAILLIIGYVFGGQEEL